MSITKCSVLQSDKEANKWLQGVCEAAAKNGGSFEITQTYNHAKDYGVMVNYQTREMKKDSHESFLL